MFHSDLCHGKPNFYSEIARRRHVDAYRSFHVPTEQNLQAGQVEVE